MLAAGESGFFEVLAAGESGFLVEALADGDESGFFVLVLIVGVVSGRLVTLTGAAVVLGLSVVALVVEPGLAVVEVVEGFCEVVVAWLEAGLELEAGAGVVDVVVADGLGGCDLPGQNLVSLKVRNSRQQFSGNS